MSSTTQRFLNRLCAAFHGALVWLPCVYLGCVANAAELRDEWVDSDTGHRVLRLSRLSGSSESFYFHQNAFTPDGNKFVFQNSQAGTNNRLFVLTWATKHLEPLTDRGVGGAVVSRHSRKVYYVQEGGFYSADLDTRQTR